MKILNSVIICLNFLSIFCSDEHNLCKSGSNQEFTEIVFHLADLITSYKENGNEFQLEAFKLAKNVEIITNENLGKQKWFSVGKPQLIETKVGNIESIFHPTLNGIYANIELLTDVQKKLLAKTASDKYRINITSDNIKTLKLSCFKCMFKLIYDNGTAFSDIYGEVKSFNQFPLRIIFNTNQEERKVFQEIYKNHDSLVLDCEWRSYELSTKTALIVEKTLIRKHNDKFDCNNGGLWACINDGKCSIDGKCECKEGYSGDNCAYCKN
jgi:hypothetical protein